MDRKKLESKIEIWAANLGFCMADGSAPPENYFASLTATPHRRQLWEVLIETVQNRQKIEQMRKQLLAFNLKQRNILISDVNDKQFSGKIQLSMRQKELEKEIDVEKKATLELERRILSKSSDLLFDICKLSELEKQCQEYKQKAVALKLLNRKEKACLEEFEELLTSIQGSKNAILQTMNMQKMREVELSQEDDVSDIKEKMKKLLQSDETETSLWEKVLAWKKDLLGNLNNLLQEMDSFQKKILVEKEEEIEKAFTSSVSKLKQDVCLKSLQVMLKEAEGQVLNSEIQNLVAKAEGKVFKPVNEGSFNDNVSYKAEEEIDSFSGKGESLVQLINHVNSVGLKSYQDFLKNELSQLQNLRLKRQDEKQEVTGGQEKLQQSLDAIESVSNEIKKLKSEQEEQRSEIIRLSGRLKELSKEIVDETKDKNFVTEVEETVEKIKNYSERQIDRFLDLPLDALRTVEDANGKRIFACESLPHCLDNYGGEFKGFFKSTLIQPYQSVESVLTEIKKRQEAVSEMRTFLSEREKQSEMEKAIFTRLMSIKCDSETWEKNFNESNKILSSTLSKANEHQSRIPFVLKLMTNWLEQPYRMMIKNSETVEGVTLREYEEMYKKLQREKSGKS
ncbi:hypothetical protein RUM43_012401 [Polyplax serrata]|uniref:Uncharacterized protein n=1 Tax=Polyplax serrata TaxID=468196 RepID=A0AAN8NRK6_POLSC